MKSIKELSKRIEDLITIADRTLTTRSESKSLNQSQVNTEYFTEFRTASFSFIRTLNGETHSYYID